MMELLLLLAYVSRTLSYGYDSGPDQGACGPQHRTSRMHKPPCDLAREGYCTAAGSAYPWHAVRRFVRENQGLMRRMYGDQRHISVLRAEFEGEDFGDVHYDYEMYKNAAFKRRYAKNRQESSDFDNELYNDEAEPRFLQGDPKREDLLNTKFIFAEDPSLSIRLGDLKSPPRFKLTTQRVTTTTDNEPERQTSNKIVFVDDNSTEATSEDVRSTLTTEKAEETTTDTTVGHGTEETATQALRTTEKAGEVLFQDMEEEKPTKTQMNFDKMKGVNACPVKEEVVAPFWANNTRGELLALLNLYPYEQYVHWEKCTFEHRQMYCRDGCRCEQQYRLHRLLAYDPNNECRGIFSDWFRFPSCCVCKCYNIPVEFRVTSRSPRSRVPSKEVPEWFRKKTGVEQN